MLYQILYSSRAVDPLNLDDLEKILEDARVGNDARDVTGALVYAEGVFLQVLEGEKSVLDDLIASIGADSRHASMKVFHRAAIDRRTFHDWRMAYLSPSVEDVSRWAGLHGASSVDDLLTELHDHAESVPKILLSVLKAISSQAGKA